MPPTHAPESHRAPPSKRVGAPSVLAIVACASLLGLAGPSCGSSSTTNGAGSGGSSGTVGSGGAGAVLGGAGTGGAAATGGTTAISGTGGIAATGGMPATGGTSAPSGAGGAGGGGGASVGGAGSGGSGASGGNGVGGAQGGGGGGSTGASGGAAASGGAGAGGGAGGFALTSPTLTEGGMFPAVNTCAGADSSPELDWTSGPATASSYALVLTDMAINLVHWVIWDIPVGARSLPAMLATTATLTTPAGARQIAASGTGYMGPCPSGNVHTYQFDLHALDVATLPAVPANATSAQVKALVMMHSLAVTSLSAQSNAKRP